MCPLPLRRMCDGNEKQKRAAPVAALFFVNSDLLALAGDGLCDQRTVSTPTMPACL